MKKKYAISALLILLTTALFAQTPLGYEALSQYPEETTFVVDDIQVEITGGTNSWLLLRKIELFKGETLKDKKHFIDYLSEKSQMLDNIRALKEKTLTVVATSLEGSLVKVVLGIKAKDGFNLIVIPYPSYSSNSGLKLSAKGRDFNFFGTLETLKLDLSYILDQRDVTKYSGTVEFTLPFKIAQAELAWALSQTLTYTADKPLAYNGATALTWYFPIANHQYYLSDEQKIAINEEDGDGNVSDFLYMTNTTTWGSSFNTPLTFGALGALKYNPSVFVKTNFVPNGAISTEKEALNLGFKQALQLGRIDWEGNLRQGLQAQLEYTHGYSIAKTNFIRELTLISTTGTQWGWGGLTTREGAFWQLDALKTDSAIYIRGILDDRISATTGIFFNFDLPITILDFRPAKWLNINWMKLFEFEMQASLFLDGMFAGTNLNNWQKPWLGSGVEVVVFPHFIRSLYVRASVGFDIQAVLENRSLSGSASRDGKSVRELSVGIGHFY